MNSDNSALRQNHLESPPPQDQEIEPVDMPPGMLTCRRGALTSPADLERLVSVSLVNLLGKFSTDQDRVEAVWLWLSMTIAEYVPWEDHRVSALAMVDLLVSMVGVDIDEQSRRAFYARHFK